MAATEWLDDGTPLVFEITRLDELFAIYPSLRLALEGQHRA